MITNLRAFIASSGLPATLTRFIDEEEGQSTVEYLLLISVIIIAVVAAAYMFMPSFQKGVQALASDVSSILDSGKIGKTGTNR
jgi:Flp pilus assembly pilin Flp